MKARTSFLGFEQKSSSDVAFQVEKITVLCHCNGSCAKLTFLTSPKEN